MVFIVLQIKIGSFDGNIVQFFFSSFLLDYHHDLQSSADGQDISQLSSSCAAIHAPFVQAPYGGLSLAVALASARGLLAVVKKLLLVPF